MQTAQTPRLKIDITKHEAHVDGRLLKLAYKPFMVLWEIAKNEGRIITRESLLQSVWGYDRGVKIDSRTVDQHIARLRASLMPSEGIIVTVPLVGYKIGVKCEITISKEINGRVREIKRSFGVNRGARVTLFVDDILDGLKVGDNLRIA